MLDRGRAQVDAIEDGGVEDVEAGVDAVAHELDRLLNEPINAGGVVRLVDNDTVFGGLLDLGDNDGALISVCLVESSQLLKRVIACDVGVEDEEGAVVLAKDLLSKLEGAGGAQRFGLDGEGDGDAKFLFILLATPESVYIPARFIGGGGRRSNCER